MEFSIKEYKNYNEEEILNEKSKITNLSKDFLSKLKENYNFNPIEIYQKYVGKDGTIKYLYKLSDGNLIEGVLMSYKYGNTICVSTQVGCRMGCKFCASTINGLERNLTAGEIYGEVLAAEKETGEKISHIVIMGTGEPFDNYENVAKFIRIINDKNGLNIGMRNITVSTCGIVPMIDKFGDDFNQVNLAISLHQVTNENRSNLIHSATDILKMIQKRYQDFI